MRCWLARRLAPRTSQPECGTLPASPPRASRVRGPYSWDRDARAPDSGSLPLMAAATSNQYHIKIHCKVRAQQNRATAARSTCLPSGRCVPRD
jgi:hypothetical protein